MRRRALSKFFLVATLCYLSYLFGLFTHLLEKNLDDFHYPTLAPQIDIKIAVKNYEVNKNLINLDEINKANYEFLLTSVHKCKSNEPFLVVLVKSKYSNFEQRKIIRETWGREDSKGLMKLVFLVGIPTPDEIEANEALRRSSDGFVETLGLNERIQMENKNFKDLVQQNFYDTYFNNTLKAVMGLTWVHTYCSNAHYYLFIDDDYFVNPKLMVKFLRENVTKADLENLYAGYVFPNSSPMRHLISKWYISLEEYPYSKFPPYVSAGCYILSQKSVRSFYIASKLVPLFRFDDIYLGILAKKLEIKPMHIENIYFSPPWFYNETYVDEVIASHGFFGEDLQNVWDKVAKYVQFD